MRQAVKTAKAPAAVGPYSQAIKTDNMVYCSGQLGLDPATGEMVKGGVEAQARQVLRNLEAVLAAAGSDLRQVVKCTVFMQDLADFAVMNKIYTEFFPADAEPPARSTFQVAKLPKDGLVEIEAIALLK
ncbi:MAG: RidA family protein [Candidatus Symbiobacter sp.]|nr:RidA family protein [Candidatus Symbiobacter sp.]